MSERSLILNRTKLNAPTINRKIIKRAKVLKKIQQSANPNLILITAPAGSGKTTAAVSLLAERGLPYAWLSLDQSDNDPVRFWRYILAAMGELGDFGKNFWDVPVKQELIVSNILADIVLDKLFLLPGKILMVLDDFHLIDNEIIHSSLAYFLKYLPSHFRMIILSRKEPDLKVMREWTQGQVVKIGARELFFDRRETAEFFKIYGYSLNTQEICAILDYTEGWAAGLVLATLSMGEEDDAHAAIGRFSGKNRHVDRLLQDEVFDRWPDRVKDFLVRIAFLDKFCGRLCQAITDFADSGKLLNKLAESNSFIVHLDQENEWFRFHHLFSDFLRQRLAMEDPALRQELYRRAGQWYHEKGMMRESIEAFVKAGAYEQAFPLLMKNYLNMAQNGEYADWMEWMDSIPPEYYEEEVRVCAGYSWLASMENRTREAQLWLEKTQCCFERIKDGLALEEKDYLEAHILVAKANLAILERDPDQVTSYFKQAGRLKLLRSIHIGEMNSGEVSILKTVYGFKGRLKKADRLYAFLVEDLPRLFGNSSAYLTIGWAECHYERNHLQTAYQLLTQGIEGILELGTPGAIVPSVITLARIKRAAGDIEGALNTIAMGRRKLSGRSKSLWNYFLDVFTAGLYLDRNDPVAAAEWLNIDRIGVFDDLSCSREYEHLTFARYLNLLNRFDDALLLLGRLESFARKEDRLGSRIEILCQKAITYQLKGDLAHAMTAVDTALNLGLEDGYCRTFLDQLEPMVEMLTKYMTWGKKLRAEARYDYAKTLLRLARENIRIFRSGLPAPDEASLQPVDEIPHLSVKEYRVLRLLAAKRSNREIAEELCVSVRTVKYYNSQIFEKLGVDNRTEAMARAWEMKILE